MVSAHTTALKPLVQVLPLLQVGEDLIMEGDSLLPQQALIQPSV